MSCASIHRAIETYECAPETRAAIELLALRAGAYRQQLRRAYARADYWEERVRVMTWWADRCDEMRRGGVVVPLRA